MKFGVREICDVVLRAKDKVKIGNQTFEKDEPVIYFDTTKTSLNTPAEEKEYKYLIKCPDCGITIKGYKRKCKSLYDAENGKSCCPTCGTSRLRIQENWI